MGQPQAKPTVPQLNIIYNGPVVGLLDQGVIQGNSQDTSALDPLLVKQLRESLGKLDEIMKIDKSDLDSFKVEIDNPSNLGFKPFFFDRKDEYGRGHIYYEGLCHGFLHRDVIKSSSARYFNRKHGTGVETPHLPATFHICAFVEAVRKVNLTFIELVKTNVTEFATNSALNEGNEKTRITESDIQDLIDGLFRNVAIQIHYGKPTRNREVLMHMDHVFSALHLAVTINGYRTIGFGLTPGQELPLELEPGDVYCTSPAAIMHGVSTDQPLSGDSKSLALQCRTLLNTRAAYIWNHHKEALCRIVNESLETKVLVMPTYEQWKEVFDESIKQSRESSDKIQFSYEADDK